MGKMGQINGHLAILSEKAMATHSSTLAWEIPWTEEPSRLQSMGSRRIGHDWATSLSLFTFMHWRRKRQPTPVFLPGESQGFCWAAVYGVTQSQTSLTWLSSSSHSMGFPGGASGKEPTCQCRRLKRCGFDPWVGKILWRRKGQPISVFLPGESHGQRSLAGYSPWVPNSWTQLSN